MNEVKGAFFEKKINMWEFEFLTDIKAEEKLTDKQYDKLAQIAEKCLPRNIILPKEKDPFDFRNSYRAPVDPYFGESYFKDDY